MRIFRWLVLAAMVISSLPLDAGEKPPERSLARRTALVLCAIHGGHLERKFGYSLARMAQAIRTIRPDLVCGEMAPEEKEAGLAGLFPPEQNFVEDVCRSIGAKYVACDWRGPEKEADNAYKAMTPAERKEFDRAGSGFLESVPKDPKVFFHWLHTEGATLIDQGQDRRVQLGTEVANGFSIARNQMIVKRSMAAANEVGARRILFVFGAAHKVGLERILKEVYQVPVEMIPEIPAVEDEAVSSTVLRAWIVARERLQATLDDPKKPEEVRKRIRESHRIEELGRFIRFRGRYRP